MTTFSVLLLHISRALRYVTNCQKYSCCTRCDFAYWNASKNRNFFKIMIIVVLLVCVAMSMNQEALKLPASVRQQKGSTPLRTSHFDDTGSSGDEVFKRFPFRHEPRVSGVEASFLREARAPTLCSLSLMRPALGPGDFTARRGPPLSVARPSPGAGCDPAPTPSQHAQASWSGGAPRPRPGKSGGRPEGCPPPAEAPRGPRHAVEPWA